VIVPDKHRNRPYITDATLVLRQSPTRPNVIPDGTRDDRLTAAANEVPPVQSTIGDLFC